METQQNSTPKARPRWVKAFLTALSETGNVTASAKLAKIDRTRAYQYRGEDESFVAEWEDAVEQAADVLELEAHRRAYHGVDEPVIHQGELSGVWVNKEGDTVAEGTDGARMIPLTVKKYSDTLLMFLLKGMRPKKFRDNVKHEHNFPDIDAAIHAELARLVGAKKTPDAGTTS